MQGGFFLYKGGDYPQRILKVKEKANWFILLDEELGPGCVNFSKNMRKRIWPGSESLIDRYYVIGSHAYEVGQSVLSEMSGKIQTTGWPRVDLWRSEMRYVYDKYVLSIREKYGDFILLTADFGYNSNKKIHDSIEIRKNSDWESIRKDVPTETRRADNVYSEYQECIKWLRKLDERDDLPQIIIRPHPAEDHAEWQRVAKSFKQIKVIYEGEVSPWIYGARAVLHRGCTSAVQAYMAGISTGYVVTKTEWIKRALPYDISEHLYTVQDVADFCKKYTGKNPTPPREYSQAFKDMIHIEEKFASELIVEDMLKLNATPEPPYKAGLKDMVYDILLNVRTELQRVKNSIFKPERKIGIAPPSQKMPGGITKQEVANLLQKISPDRQFKVRKVFKDCIEIEEL